MPTNSDGDLDRPGHADQVPSPQDKCKPFRIVLDVLATQDQVDRLHDPLGELLCGAPPEQDGPCRIGCGIGSTREPDSSDDPDDVNCGYDADSAAFTRDYLSLIEVWDKGRRRPQLGALVS